MFTGKTQPPYLTAVLEQDRNLDFARPPNVANIAIP